MTTNKPGSETQQPLFGCTSCYEHTTYPADYLRVYNGECWCEDCWDYAAHEIAGGRDWSKLEPFKPALQAECEKLRKDAERYRWWRDEAGSVLYGNEVIDLMGDPDAMDCAIDAAMETKK